jgi:lambda family phage portal protein
MTPFLRALAWVAPQAALNRARAQMVLRQAEAYDGAIKGRRGSSFRSYGQTSANSALSGALPALRERSREIVRTTWIGARALDILTAQTVGTGITVRFDTGSRRLDAQVQALWDDWCASCDIERVLDFGGLQAMAYRAAMEGGDCVIRMIARRFDDRSRPVPLALQVNEGDWIDETKDSAGLTTRRDKGRARLGVELGDFDERKGLWLHTSAPGENISLSGGYAQSQFYSRADVCHLYRPLRPGQVRGVPVFAPVLMTARDYADFMDALVVKARMEACIGLIITKSDSSTGLAGSAAKTGQERTESLKPGAQIYFEPGEEVKEFNPASTSQVDAVSVQALMGIAAGVGITYDQLTGDLRQANYSSLRAGKIEVRRLAEQHQYLMLIPMMLDRIVERFLEVAIATEKLRARIGGYKRHYLPPANEPIDPRKDLEADILAVRSGRLSPQDFIGAWGRDWREVIGEYQDFFKEIDAQGLVFDIDPRRVAQSGKTQASTPAGNDVDEKTDQNQ